MKKEKKKEILIHNFCDFVPNASGWHMSHVVVFIAIKSKRFFFYFEIDEKKTIFFAFEELNRYLFISESLGMYG